MVIKSARIDFLNSFRKTASAGGESIISYYGLRGEDGWLHHSRLQEKCTHEKISDAQLKSNLIEVAFIIKP